MTAESTAAWRWRLFDDNTNEWEWGRRARRRHDLSGWLPAIVPASVQETLLRARRIPHPYRDLASRAAEWIEHRDWIYGCDFALPPPTAGRVFLEFAGVTDCCSVYLNGEAVGEHEGPSAPFALEIGPQLREPDNQLLVLLPAPPSEDPQIGRADRTRSLRGRMGYGWDFAPRLVRVGILGPVSLRRTGAWRLSDLWARAALTADRRRAVVTLRVSVDGPEGAAVRFTIRRGAQVVAAVEPTPARGGQAEARVEIPRAALWWPAGMGPQPLYTARAECADGSDSIETTFGLRDIAWEGRPGGAPDDWPFTLVVNGRRVFQRGWNWVPADSMGGPPADRQAARVLRLARDAGVNVLRCWGGGDPETPAFYDACDRLGLLVWQEFPLSSAGINNVPPVDPAFLDRMATYAGAVAAARRNHPSLLLWGGGNELLEPDGRPLTMEHPYAARVGAALAAADPDRAFRPSSPLGPVFEADPEKGPLWDVHGSWEYSERWPGPQYWRLNAVRPLLHSELGLPGEADLAVQRRWLSAAEREPGSAGRRHHCGAWWDHWGTLARVFGPIADPELATLASQWLQAEGLRYYAEETRRRWPDTAGIYPWQLNEPWPNVTCTSAVSYGGRPKLAYYAVAGAYRPAVISVRYSGLRVAPGEPLQVALWALNDGPAMDAELRVRLTALDGRLLWEDAPRSVSVPAGENVALGEVTAGLPDGFSGVMLLDVELGALRNRYMFSNAPEPPLRDALAAPAMLAAMFRPAGA